MLYLKHWVWIKRLLSIGSVPKPSFPQLSSYLLISDVTKILFVHVKWLYTSDAKQAVHGYITACSGCVDNDGIFGWEVHLRAVCLSGFPSRSWDDVGANWDAVKNQGNENLPLYTISSHRIIGWVVPQSLSDIQYLLALPNMNLTARA